MKNSRFTEEKIIQIDYYRMLYLNRNVDQVALSSTGGIDFKWAKVDRK